MALMEDTGWYLPNYEMADELKWGSQLGNKIIYWFEPTYELEQGLDLVGVVKQKTHILVH